MKVTATFRIELERPELTREEAEALYQKLGEALGKVPVYTQPPLVFPSGSSIINQSKVTGIS